MDIRMSSLPGGGLLGGGGGGCGHFMGKNTKHPIGPQVTLNMSVHPPVLDMAGLKPTSKSTSTSCTGGGTKKVGGQWWTSIRNMYNNLCSGTPVTWVNPDMVQQFQPAVMAQSLYPGTQYPVVGNQNPPLWFHATPGSQFDYQDPLQSVSYPIYDTGPPAYPKEFIPSPANEFHKSTQPLNPEAKEWIPSSYKNGASSVPKCSFTSPDNNNVQNPLVIGNMSVGFIEITDSEIEEVRKDMQNEFLKKAQDHKITETSNNKQKPSCDVKIEVVGIGSNRLKESHKDAENSNKESINCNTTNVIKLDGTLAERQEDSRNDTSFDEQHKDSLSLSYASIARKSPEPPLQTKVEMGSEKESFSPAESVKQPLPKIFMKDKKYPKEKAAPLMENKKRDPLPFRTASKTQKKSSRKFLKDLREVSPSKSDSSFTSNDCSFESVESEVMSRLCIGNSPASVRLTGSMSPREMSVSSYSISPSMSPRDTNVSSCSTPPKNMKQHSMSESSGSSDSNVRTISESSTGSVESVDIEFGDDCDIGNNNLENIFILTEACQSKSSSSGKCPESSSALVEICPPKSSKHPNNILAHILGFDDSESEDSDSDDDSDWDDADECDTLVLDDTWETFGLNLPSITKSLPCSKSSAGDNGDNLNSENICDIDYCNISLEDINKQWEEEVAKDVMTASPSRVRFGDVNVHPMIAWSYAYRNARRGPWEQHARDRARFSNRISALEPILSPVLKTMQCKIYGS